MQTRNYKHYNVSSAVPFARGVNLVNFDGFYSGAGGKWLQIHDAAALPANDAVPLRSYPLLGGPINLPSDSFQFSPLRLVNGLVFAISSTEGTLTIDTDKMDIWGLVEEWETSNTDLGASISSGTGTSLAVWLQADTGIERALFEVSVTNITGRAAATKRWILLCDDDDGAHVMQAFPLFTLDNYNSDDPTVTNKDSLSLKFGLGGQTLTFKNRGCSLFYSDSPTEWNDPGSEGCTFTAYHK